MKITLSKSQWEFVGKKTGWLKTLSKNITSQTEGHYKSDEDIADEFRDVKVLNVSINPDKGHDFLSGDIEIAFPHAGESVAGGQEEDYEGSDHWIFYNFKEWKDSLEQEGEISARIAFDQWYPDDTYSILKNAILRKIRNRVRSQMRNNKLV
jgi:hypothetical protein